MKFDKYISVVMPVFNNSEYLNAAVQSILNQTYRKFELIIINDGSTDNTDDIILSFRDERIRYFRIEHSGKGSALNFGLQNAKYDWVALMDADDIAHPERFEYQLNYKNLAYNDLVFPDAAYFLETRIKFLSKISSDSEVMKKVIRLHGHICPGVIINKEFILSLGGFDETIGNSEDYELWMRIFDKVNFVHVNVPLMFVRIRDNSLSRKNYKNTKETIYFIKSKYNIQYSGIAEAWNEFFYGSRYKARIVFKKYLLNPKAALGYVISFFPESIFNYIINNKVIPGLKYSFYKIIFFQKHIRLQNQLNVLLIGKGS